jgi:hypothetical protein
MCWRPVRRTKQYFDAIRNAIANDNLSSAQRLLDDIRRSSINHSEMIDNKPVAYYLSELQTSINNRRSQRCASIKELQSDLI